MEKSEEQPQVQDLVGELLAEVAEQNVNLVQQVWGLPEHLVKLDAPEEDTLRQVVRLLKEVGQNQVWDLVEELLAGHLQDHTKNPLEEELVLDQEEETSDDSIDIFIKSTLPVFLLF